MWIRNRPEDFHHAPRCYNHLPLFEHQKKEIPVSVLETLANIFLRHGMHTEFGISLLHRHCETSSNSVMVHSKSDQDICLPLELGSCDIAPSLFFFCRTQEEFLPLEFEAAGWRTECMPSETFLSDLASFLRGQSLDNVLGHKRRSISDSRVFDSVCLNL